MNTKRADYARPRRRYRDALHRNLGSTKRLIDAAYLLWAERTGNPTGNSFHVKSCV